MLTKNQAMVRKPYWIASGKIIFLTDDYKEKWNGFVDSQIELNNGEYIDGIIQIITMLKGHVDMNEIVYTIKETPDGELVLNNYLGAFIAPEVYQEIKEKFNQKRL